MKSKKFKVHSGSLARRSFCFPSILQGHSCFTPGVLKEAVFELIRNRLGMRQESTEDYSFFDLCAGSGQMGIEAASLGFSRVYLNEIDQKRFLHIKKQIGRDTKINGRYNASLPNALENIRVYHRDFRCMSSLICKQSQSILYIDMPYSFWDRKNKAGLKKFLLELEEEAKSLAIYMWIFIQGPRFFQPEEISSARNVNFRNYGKQHLSFWLQGLF